MFHKCHVLPAVLVIAGMFASANAAEPDDRYLGIQVNAVNVDSDRRVEGNGFGVTFLKGFPIRDNIFIEARLTGLVLERGIPDATDFYQQDIGADAVYWFDTFGGGWQPFVLGGLAAIRDDTDIDEEDGFSLGVHAGGGIVSGPLGNLGLKFRADLRYVHDEFMDGMQDIRLGLGIQIPLGEKSRPSAASRSGDFKTLAGGEDRDDDGVADVLDRCPNSLSYVRHDERGCMEPNQTIRLYEVTFNNGTSILTAAAREELASIVRALRGQPDLRVQINGHTDSLGDPDANQALSIERAEAVATYLALQGVPTQRLTIKGFGQTQPVESNSTAAGRERNRRIEIVLLEPLSH